jgi:hypothetical protein
LTCAAVRRLPAACCCACGLLRMPC